MGAVQFKPSNGGQLITSRPASEAGPANYTVKRNWRRVHDCEVWREGFAPFIPDVEADDGAVQHRPTTSAIRLIKRVLWENGESSLVVGSATELFLFDQPGYYVETGYVAADYTVDNQRWRRIASGLSPNGRRWQAKMDRGELWLNNAVDLAMVYKRGADRVTPCYELREQGIVTVGSIAVLNSVPICAGVTEVAGGDDGLASLLALISSGTVTASQAGARDSGVIGATITGGGITAVVTASSAFFQVSDIGRQVQFSDGQRATIFSYSSSTIVSVSRIGTETLVASTGATCRITDAWNPAATSVDAWSLTSTAPFFTLAMVGRKVAVGSEVRTIVAFVSSTHVKVDSDIPAPAATALVENVEAYLRRDQMLAPPDVDERNDTVLWGNLTGPTDFGISLRFTGTAGSALLTTTLQTNSFAVGQEVIVEGAGTDGGSLTSDPQNNPVTILSIGPGTVQLSTPVLTGGADLRLRRSTAVGGIVGFEELGDDGGAIIAAENVNGLLVLHKDRSAYTAQYTGVVAKPLVFTPITMPHDRAVHFRHCVASVNDEVQVFPGRTAFWMLDPTTRKVRPVPNADLVEDLFFNYASIADTESIFVADNTVTQELWWFNAANTDDPILCYDYRWGTFSTVDNKGTTLNGEEMPAVSITAAASIQGPGYAVAGETETWFLLGCADGRLLVYGAVSAIDAGKPDWQRKALYSRQPTEDPDSLSTYECKLASGLSSFGDEFNQKMAKSYLIQLGAPPSLSPDVTVEFWQSNGSNDAKKVGEREIVDVGVHGLIPLHLTAHNLQDVVISRPPAGEVVTPLRLLFRAWDISNLKDRSHSRR